MSEPSPDELYVAVRHGVRDALWDVLGAVAVVVFGVLLFFLGVGAFVAGVRADAPASYVGFVVALGLFAAATYQFARAGGYDLGDLT